MKDISSRGAYLRKQYELQSKVFVATVGPDYFCVDFFSKREFQSLF